MLAPNLFWFCGTISTGVLNNSESVKSRKKELIRIEKKFSRIAKN
jgi:hypothetical protein